MANEITVSVQLQLANGDLKINSYQTGKKFTQTTARGGGPGTVNVGLTEETISFGDIVPGFVMIRNLDTTNYVRLGFSTGVYGIRLLPGGGPALIYLETGASLFAIANTAACNIQIDAINV